MNRDWVHSLSRYYACTWHAFVGAVQEACDLESDSLGGLMGVAYPVNLSST